MNILTWINVDFQPRDRQEAHNFNNDTFYRPPVTNAQCISGTGKYPDSAYLLNSNDDAYSQGYGQIEEAFMALTKDDILQPCISDDDFRSSNDDNDIGYNLYVFDIRYKKNLESAQPIKVEFSISENLPAGLYGYSSVLRNNLVSIS